jgi:general secretion pathway protein D
MPRHLRFASVALVALWFGSCPIETVTAREAPPADSGKPRLVTMNFQDVDIHVLARFMSDLTGRNFLLDPSVKGKVTVLSPGKITIAEAYEVFQSILEVHGFTTVPSGRITKIVPAVGARSKAIDTFRPGAARGAADQMITQLLPLDHADCKMLSTVFQPLVAREGILLPYEETNTLIITDMASNVDRIVRLIDAIDIPGNDEVEIFALAHAEAESLGRELTDLYQGTQAKGKELMSFKIIPDKRANSLIVRAGPEQMEELRRLIDKLDRKQVRSREGIHIYPLENAVAEDLASVLMEIPGKGGEASEKGVVSQAPVISKDVQISADKATNSLVIIAEPEEFEVLRGIISRLDIPRTMVYVEALIVEASATRSLDLGVEWQLGNEYDGGFNNPDRPDGGVWLGGSRGRNDNLANFAAGMLPSGFTAGVVGRAITLGDVVFPSLGAFIRAVEADTDFNVLSTPQILTLDNEEAMIEVGENIPFVSRVDQGTETDSRLIQNFEYKDVGVTLKVTPHINRKRQVRLLVEESVKDVVNRTALGGTVLAPTTTYRTAKTTLTVNDGETAVIGGLIRERTDRFKEQTPCLGGIPALGWLFKSTSDQDEKINLLVFLTPHIIEKAEERQRLYMGKKGEIEEMIDRSRRGEQIEPLRRFNKNKKPLEEMMPDG